MEILNKWAWIVPILLIASVITVNIPIQTINIARLTNTYTRSYSVLVTTASSGLYPTKSEKVYYHATMSISYSISIVYFGMCYLGHTNCEGGEAFTYSFPFGILQTVPYSTSTLSFTTAGTKTQSLYRPTSTSIFETSTKSQMFYAPISYTLGIDRVLITSVGVMLIILCAAAAFIVRLRASTKAKKVETDVTPLSTKVTAGKRLCIECGNGLRSKSKFCDNCGTKQP